MTCIKSSSFKCIKFLNNLDSNLKVIEDDRYRTLKKICKWNSFDIDYKSIIPYQVILSKNYHVLIQNTL